METMEKINYKKISSDIRKKILKMKLLSQGSHIGSAFSCVDILTVLYFKILRIDPKKPKDPDRDRFILSKGHGASAVYATLVERGFASEKILDTYCQDNSELSGHAMKDSVPGVEVSTGSLGHGLPIGLGMALAGKKDKKDYRVFVIISDGECDEGTTWEAALFASHHRLDNLVTILDYNKIQSFGRPSEILNLEPLKEKWTAFGWEVKEVNGHDFGALETVLESIPFNKNKPNLIIAHTTKGKGVSFMEDQLAWHYKSPTQEQYETGIKELDESAK